MSEWLIGKIRVQDRDNDDRYNSEIDTILNENDEEIPIHSDEVEREIQEIGLSSLRDLPLSMTSQLHSNYLKLTALGSTMRGVAKSNSLFNQVLQGPIAEIEGKQRAIREYVSLQEGLRQYCAYGMDAVRAYILAGNVAFQPDLEEVADGDLPQATSAFFLAAQEKAAELKEGRFGFDPSFKPEEFADFYDRAITTGLENYFYRARYDIASNRSIERTQEILDRAYDFCIEYNCEYDPVRAEEILQKVDENRPISQGLNIFGDFQHGLLLFKALNPSGYRAYQRKMMEQRLKYSRP